MSEQLVCEREREKMSVYNVCVCEQTQAKSYQTCEPTKNHQ